MHLILKVFGISALTDVSGALGGLRMLERAAVEVADRLQRFLVTYGGGVGQHVLF